MAVRSTKGCADIRPTSSTKTSTAVSCTWRILARTLLSTPTKRHNAWNVEAKVARRGQSAFARQLALLQYEELRAARQQEGRAALDRERAAHDVHAFRSQSYAEKSARDSAKGGRGIGRK
jgi:hypothetical protein